jgi:hypothetical protein
VATAEWRADTIAVSVLFYGEYREPGGSSRLAADQRAFASVQDQRRALMLKDPEPGDLAEHVWYVGALSFVGAAEDATVTLEVTNAELAAQPIVFPDALDLDPIPNTVSRAGGSLRVTWPPSDDEITWWVTSGTCLVGAWSGDQVVMNRAWVGPDDGGLLLSRIEATGECEVELHVQRYRDAQGAGGSVSRGVQSRVTTFRSVP